MKTVFFETVKMFQFENGKGKRSLLKKKLKKSLFSGQNHLQKLTQKVLSSLNLCNLMGLL